ncbi:MAG: PKD domain-containing protein [Bacteroidales bacterium]|jgi:PKD repeat protein|nr:PKD domain-containing protein [Bacteroidales bacterium]
MKIKIKLVVWCILCAGILFSCKEEEKEAAPLPVAGFSFAAEQAHPLTVHFTNESTNAESYSWNFGDNSELSAETNPVHTYAAGDSYTVTLTATNSEGKSDKKTLSVAVMQPAPANPVANFEYVIDPANPLTVHFTDFSENAVSHSWDFGDGSAPSDLQNPDHTYAAAGVYSVVLTVRNANGDEHQKTVEVAVVDPSAPVPLTVRLTDHNASQLTITPDEGEWQLDINGGDAYFYLDAPQGIDISTATHYILSFEAQFTANPADIPMILFLQANGWPNSIIDHDLGYKISNSAEWQTLSIDLTLVRRPGSADVNNNVSQAFPAAFNYIKFRFGNGSHVNAGIRVRNFAARMATSEEKADVPAVVRATDNNQCTITGSGDAAGWNIAIPDNSNDPYFFVDFSVPPLWGANHVLSFESRLDVAEADLCMFVGRFENGYLLHENNVGLKIQGSSDWRLHTYDLQSLNFFVYGPYVPLQWMRLRVGTDNAAKDFSIRNIKMTHP